MSEKVDAGTMVTQARYGFANRLLPSQPVRDWRAPAGWTHGGGFIAQSAETVSMDVGFPERVDFALARGMA